MWIVDRNTTTQHPAWQPAADRESYLHIADSADLHTDTETRDKVRLGRVLWGMLTPRSTQLLMLVFRASISPAAAAFIQNFKLYLRVTNDNKVILVCEAPGGFRWQWMKTKSV